MPVRRLLGALAVVALIAGGCVAPVPPPADSAAPAPKPGPSRTTGPDFDGDGRADIAFTDQHLPVVHDLRVRYGSGELAVFTPVQVTDVDDGDLFGPVIARDLNADGYSDLAFLASLDLDRKQWRLYTLFGSSSGLQLESLRQTALPTVTGDGYAAYGPLAVVDEPVPRLVLGMSPFSGGTNERQLAVYRLVDGLPSGEPELLRPGTGELTLDSSRGFGWALASAGNQLFVGASDATVGGMGGAGAVAALTFDDAGVAASQIVSEETPGVDGDPAPDEWFGHSLAASDGLLVVGVPRELTAKDDVTGAVQVFTTAGGTLVPAQHLAPGKDGVPGKAGDGHQFGWSVAVGTICPDVPGIVVGGPGATITGTSNGAAWLIPLESSATCPARQLYAGKGLPGESASFRELGRIVAVSRDREAQVDDIVVVAGGDSAFSNPGRLFVWSNRTHELVLRLDECPNSVAGR